MVLTWSTKSLLLGLVLSSGCVGLSPIAEHDIWDSDLDGDGLSPAEGDCDDGNPAVHPNAAEVCDGLDNDCEGTTDEGVVFSPEGVDLVSTAFAVNAATAPSYASGRHTKNNAPAATSSTTTNAIPNKARDDRG